MRGRHRIRSREIRDNGATSSKSDDTPKVDVPPDPEWPTFAEPEEVRLFRDERGIVRCTLRGRVSFPRIHVHNAFPVSEGKRYLAITDGGDRHVAVVRDAPKLDPESRGVADEELWRRYVVPKIQEIYSMRERFGVAEWHVLTDRGETKFTMRGVRENVRELTPGRFIITDADGNRYEVADIRRLPARSRALIEALR